VSATAGNAKSTLKTTFALTHFACPKIPVPVNPTGTIVETGLPKTGRVQVVINVENAAASVSPQVCVRSPEAFASQSPSTQHTGGGTGLLLPCTATNHAPPCVDRVVGTPAGFTVIAVFKTVVIPALTFSVQFPSGIQTWLKRLAQGRVGAKYSAQLCIQGGTSPFHWKVAPVSGKGKLPPGLKLGVANGTISGIPTARGAYGPLVYATDSTKPDARTSPELYVPITIK
jgi:Putative Ig domain